MTKNIYALENDNQSKMEKIADLYDLEHMEKHVILHFDAQKYSPDVFSIMFQVMNISDKVTTEYNQFKTNNEKIFFICNYRTFRGLEYSRVIIVADSSLHHFLHYLPECFSRCTVYLHICKLKMLSLVGNFKSNKTFDDIISAWKETEFDKLVDQRKIQLSEYKKDCIELSMSTDTEKFTIRIKPDEFADIEEQIAKFKSKNLTESHSQALYNQKEMERIKQR